MLTYNNYEKVLRSMTSMFYFITEPRIKEFIILDNGSYQHELKVFLRRLEEQVSKFRVIWSDKNLGIAKGRKVLFDVAEGEYIASFDSDIVIINPPLFLEIFYRSLEIPDMMLVGGGGGDHTYFPSLERENIDNKPTPETHQELKVVEEVAGWFHGFKSKILTKNGGKIEMDEQFSPFWAEDSDFCMQIRVSGGKCCIMGKGAVGHQWSSCDKKKTQDTLEDMWNKFQDKWYGIFGKDFIMDIDEKFYEENYPKSKIMKRRREFYYKVGMIEGHFYSKEPIKLFFNNIEFISNTEMKLKDNKQIMSIQEFNNKVFTYDNIIRNNFTIIGGNLPKKMDTLIVLTVFNTSECLKILKTLVSIQYINVVVCLSTYTKHSDIEEFLKRYNCKYLITKFPNLNFDLIPYIINVKELSKKYTFSKVLNLSTERDNSEYLIKPLENFKEGYYLEKQLEKLDKFNMSFIDQVLTLDQNMMWNKDCIYYESFEFLDKLFNSFPLMDTLIKCLKIPKKYNNYVSPRCSPKHSLERLIGYLKPKILRDYKTYYTVICELNNEEDLQNLQKNLLHYTKGQICILNKGEFNKINLKQLNCDYYFAVNKELENKQLWSESIKNINIQEYTNFVFCDSTFKIVDSVENFFDRAIFKNIAFIQDEKEIKDCLFSIVFENLTHFVNSINEKEYNFSNILKSMNTKVIWNTKEEEKEEEIIIEYFKNNYDDGEDIPISFY